MPSIRVRVADAARAVRGDGEYVLYWMTAFRRTRWNYALQQAVAWARDLQKPLLIFEPLRCDYRWASDRLHRFVIQGMVDNRRRLKKMPAAYYPYVEPARGAGRGLLGALAERACVVIGDDYPCFFLPRMVRAAAEQVPTRLELIDSNGILPLRAAERVFARAYDFRRFLQRTLPPWLEERPEPDPLHGVRLPRLECLPEPIASRWPAADFDRLARDEDGLRHLPIDHAVGPGAAEGGAAAAERALSGFVAGKLSRYADDRNDPDESVTSGLSPYLHFGHISPHQVLAESLARDGWTAEKLAPKATGKSEGWWGAERSTESFLDELITWRELGYNMSWQREDHDRYESLPDWAQATLRKHARDPREHVYTAEEFAAARTHDPLWNAAERQLVREGRIHNYLRMLWGKKILEWSETPQQAAETMVRLNDRYALDGRDPNSYSGIYWVLGRYDRAWGPERPVFGTIRYMSSENTARKLRVRNYIARYGERG